jgi:hypothetical protein
MRVLRNTIFRKAPPSVVHLNSEAGNDEIQNIHREVFILWELHSKILVGDKNLL